MIRNKPHMRLLSALMALVMVLSLLPAAALPARAADETSGSISATVRIDYDQTLTELQERGLQAEILQDGQSLGVIDLTRAGTQDLDKDYTALVSIRDQSGSGPVTGEWPGYLDFAVNGLPLGDYTLRFSGTGYVPYEETIRMIDYSHHLIVGTGDATFTLGDVNGDKKVDEADLERLSAALGSENPEDLAVYDLSGDGAVDIVDLAYVNRMIEALGGSQDVETVLLAPPVDLAALESQAAQYVNEGDSLGDLFVDNGKTVTFTPDDDGLIILPIEFHQTTELESLRIVSPDTAAPLAGTVEVEDENGQKDSYDFALTVPAGIQVLSAQEESNTSVISINLGRRVAVKKVTIIVTETEEGYATVETIEFLKEMSPVDPEAAAGQVTGLTAEAGSEQVSLRWNSLPNISGYQVTWYPESKPGQIQQKYVETNRLVVTGLENLTTYVFTVTAVDGNWSGKPSEPVYATPQPASAPKAPDMVTVTALDGALAVSWKEAKGATYYEVYYTDDAEAGTDSYTRWGEALAAPSTSTTITGLTNGVTYSIYITAGNDIGVSSPSRISTGTPVAVIYERPAGLPSMGVLDYQDYADIRLAAPNNYSRTECPDFDPWHMADGDFSTQWTTRDWWYNEHVIVTFKEPQDLTAALWIPRMEGSYASNMRAYSVLVWYEGEDLNGPGHHVTPGMDNNGNTDGGDVHTWPAIRGNPSATKIAIMPFEVQRNVIQISVAAEQRNYLATNLSELMFLKYNENYRLPDDIAELFADELRTALAPTATQERVDELRARLNSDEQNYYMDLKAMADELDLAEELLRGETGSSVFLYGVDSRSGRRDSAAYGQTASDLQPLGAAAAANAEITIYAQGIPEGESVTVYATQFNAEASEWRASAGALKNGRNVLTIPKIGSQNTPRGGSLYITYSGTNPEDIQLHIRRATPIPMLDVSGWSEMDGQARMEAVDGYLAALDSYLAEVTIGNNTTDWHNVTEIATPDVLLSLPAKAVSSGLRGDRTAQLIDAVDAWAQLMEICRTVQGIDGVMETRQNIRCMQMFTGAFMYAAGAHIGIGYGSCSGMVGGAPVSAASSGRLYGWGIAHEIGHNMDKLGKAEITNNIYSLAVQTYDGYQNTGTSRLEASGKYPAIFNKVAQGYPGASNDVFVQLGMYWQLHLAYDDGADPLNFYTEFFTAWKAGTYFGGAASYDDRVALTASAVAGKDLTEFFTHWGMTLSEDTKTTLRTSYAREDRAVWYLNDQSRRDRLDGVSPTVGTVSAEAVKRSDTDVELTFGVSGSGAVQGYEIRRNDRPIAFTSGNTYTDTIGTSNNRTYTYTVIAYDTLGNYIDEAVSNEIRIAYDLTVDPDSYTMIQNGPGSVLAVMNQPTAVTGLKFPAGAGVDLSALQITITENGEDIEAGNCPPEVQTSDDGLVTYFQRPGADETQSTQVWTYQASRIGISGLPDTVTADDIQLISYMGDDIAFLDGPTVGLMAHDYWYGDGADDVIREGTLVVIGTYRGDPMYNTIRIQGDFAAPDMSQENEDLDPERPVQDTRPLNGEAILFAAESSDMTYTNISDGIFIFIPNVQAEAELTGNSTSCGTASVLPSRIRAELWRTTDPYSSEGTRCTAQTLWINSPGGTDLPLVELKGDIQ